jgi:hypothetical protein
LSLLRPLLFLQWPTSEVNVNSQINKEL